MIDLLKAGQQPTLLHTSKANELIKAINAIMRAEVVPTGTGHFEFADGNAKLVLTFPAASTNARRVLFLVASNGEFGYVWGLTDGDIMAEPPDEGGEEEPPPTP
jgi:hypothetical protein